MGKSVRVDRILCNQPSPIYPCERYLNAWHIINNKMFFFAIQNCFHAMIRADIQELTLCFTSRSRSPVHGTTPKGCHISQHMWYQLNASANTSCLVHELRKSNHTVRSYCQKCDPIPQKSIIAVDSRCLSITSRNILFHHCTHIKMYFWTPQHIVHAQIVTSHFVLFLD